MKTVRKAVLSVLFSLFGMLLFAQSTTLSIQGIETDSTGASVSEAKVTVTDLGVNVASSITTDGSGEEKGIQ